jgi:hypothetical protein
MTKNNENVLKLLMLNKVKEEYLTAEISPSLPPSTIKSYTIKLEKKVYYGLSDGFINRPKDKEGQ